MTDLGPPRPLRSVRQPVVPTSRATPQQMDRPESAMSDSSYAASIYGKYDAPITPVAPKQQLTDRSQRKAPDATLAPTQSRNTRETARQHTYEDVPTKKTVNFHRKDAPKRLTAWTANSEMDDADYPTTKGAHYHDAGVKNNPMYDESDSEASPTKVARLSAPKLTATTFSNAKFPDIPPARPMRTKTTISLRGATDVAPPSADPTLLSTDDEDATGRRGHRQTNYGTVTGVRRETIMSVPSSKHSVEDYNTHNDKGFDHPPPAHHPAQRAPRGRKVLSVDTTLDRRGQPLSSADSSAAPQMSAPVFSSPDRARVHRRKSQKTQHGVKKQWHALLRFLTIESSPEGTTERGSSPTMADDEREGHHHHRSNSDRQTQARRPHDKGLQYDSSMSPKTAAMTYRGTAPQRPIRPMTQVMSRQGTMKRSRSTSKHAMETRQGKHMTATPPVPLPKDTVYLQGGLSAFAQIKTSTTPFHAKNPRPSQTSRERQGVSMAASVGPSEMRTSSKRLSKYPANFDAKWSSDEDDDNRLTMGNEDMDMDSFISPTGPSQDTKGKSKATMGSKGTTKRRETDMAPEEDMVDDDASSYRPITQLNPRDSVWAP